MAEGCKRFFFYLVSFSSLLLISISSFYCLSTFLPLIGYQHFFFPKQNMNSSSGAMSRSPKSHSLFGMAEELGKEKVLFYSSTSSFFLHQLFFLLLQFHQLFFRQSRKEKLQKKAALSRKEIVRCFRAMEIIGSGGCGAGTRRFVSAFLLLSVGLRFWFTFFTFEGYRAQTPCDLYSLLLVISYHPPASYWGRSVF